MIGVPFEDNDLTCLGAITELVAALVEQRELKLVELAAQYPTTAALATWIRSLPQRNDDGAPDDGPKVDACLPPQRLRIGPSDPNCVERAALYLGVAELIDPLPVRRLATLDFEWGRHTFPVEEGAPVVLDPRATYEELAQAIPAEDGAAGVQRNRRRVRLVRRSMHRADSPRFAPTQLDPAEIAMLEPAAPPSDQIGAEMPVAIDVNDAIDFTSQLAQRGAATIRNGPSRAYLARNAIQGVVHHGVAPSDPRTVDAIGWFFSIAEKVARDYGGRALTIVRTTALAISDLIDDILAQRQSVARNLSFEIGGTSYRVPSWLSSIAGLAGRIGLDVGALALAPKLAALGITGPMLELVEQELNAEGLSLGPLVTPKRSFASALSSLSNMRPA